MEESYKSGPVNALLRAYQKVIDEFSKVLSVINEEEYLFLVDPNSEDKDCISIQTIISHVVHSGYGYSHYLRTYYNIESERPDYELLEFAEIKNKISSIYFHMEKTFRNLDLSYEEVDVVQIETPWNGKYSVEQLMEHAIVHLIRHENQIERFLHKINRKK